MVVNLHRIPIAGGFTAAKVSKAKTGEVNKKAVVAAAVGGAVIGGLAGWGFGTVANAIGAAVASKAAAAASSTAPVVNKAIESVSTAIQPYYPPNDGFAGIPQKITLEVGTMLQRTGSLYGSFVAPAGTPSQMLALPYDKIGQVPVYLQVQQPLQVLAGKVAPWFGQMGGGTQYVLNSSVQQLITDGVLRLME